MFVWFPSKSQSMREKKMNEKACEETQRNSESSTGRKGQKPISLYFSLFWLSESLVQWWPHQKKELRKALTASIVSANYTILYMLRYYLKRWDISFLYPWYLHYTIKHWVHVFPLAPAFKLLQVRVQSNCSSDGAGKEKGYKLLLWQQ